MTDQFAKIRQLAAGASPGPWSVEWDWSDVEGEAEKWAHALVGPPPASALAMGPTEFSEMRTADLEFIVAARDAVPALLAEIDQLRFRLSQIRSDV